MRDYASNRDSLVNQVVTGSYAKLLPQAIAIADKELLLPPSSRVAWVTVNASTSSLATSSTAPLLSSVTTSTAQIVTSVPVAPPARKSALSIEPAQLEVVRPPVPRSPSNSLSNSLSAFKVGTSDSSFLSSGSRSCDVSTTNNSIDVELNPKIDIDPPSISHFKQKLDFDIDAVAVAVAVAKIDIVSEPVLLSEPVLVSVSALVSEPVVVSVSVSEPVSVLSSEPVLVSPVVASEEQEQEQHPSLSLSRDISSSHQQMPGLGFGSVSVSEAKIIAPASGRFQGRAPIVSGSSPFDYMPPSPSFPSISGPLPSPSSSTPFPSSSYTAPSSMSISNVPVPVSFEDSFQRKTVVPLRRGSGLFDTDSSSSSSNSQVQSKVPSAINTKMAMTDASSMFGSAPESATMQGHGPGLFDANSNSSKIMSRASTTTTSKAKMSDASSMFGSVPDSAFSSAAPSSLPLTSPSAASNIFAQGAGSVSGSSMPGGHQSHLHSRPVVSPYKGLGLGLTYDAGDVFAAPPSATAQNVQDVRPPSIGSAYSSDGGWVVLPSNTPSATYPTVMSPSVMSPSPGILPPKAFPSNMNMNMNMKSVLSPPAPALSSGGARVSNSNSMGHDFPPSPVDTGMPPSAPGVKKTPPQAQTVVKKSTTPSPSLHSSHAYAPAQSNQPVPEGMMPTPHGYVPIKKAVSVQSWEPVPVPVVTSSSSSTSVRTQSQVQSLSQSQAQSQSVSHSQSYSHSQAESHSQSVVDTHAHTTEPPFAVLPLPMKAEVLLQVQVKPTPELPRVTTTTTTTARNTSDDIDIMSVRRHGHGHGHAERDRDRKNYGRPPCALMCLGFGGRMAVMIPKPRHIKAHGGRP